MKRKFIICFDLDNVICTTIGKNYLKAKPKKKIINLINRLYEDNYEIRIFTARYMGRNKDNIKKAKKQGFKLTFNQLKKWKVKYHKLMMGKPSYDLFIDDKAFGFKKDWYLSLKSKIKR